MAVIACLVLRENSNLKFQSNLNFLSWFEAAAVAASASHSSVSAHWQTTSLSVSVESLVLLGQVKGPS